MDGRTETRRDYKKKNKGSEVVESLDRPRPEGTWHTEEEEFNIHRTNWSQEKQRKIASNLPNELVWMDGRTATGIDSKERNIT